MSGPLPSPVRPIRGAGRRRSLAATGPPLPSASPPPGGGVPSSAWSSTPSSSLLARLAPRPPGSVRSHEMSSVLVTGAHGLVGSRVVARLQAAGEKVVGVGREQEELRQPKQLEELVEDIRHEG